MATASGTSPSKKSIIWDSLWYVNSVDNMMRNVFSDVFQVA